VRLRPTFGLELEIGQRNSRRGEAEGRRNVSRLNAGLFQQSEDVYLQASLDLVMEAGEGQLPPIPRAAKDEATRVFTRAVDGKYLRRYGDSFFETLGVAYRFAQQPRSGKHSTATSVAVS
jgi:hypothetical protein